MAPSERKDMIDQTDKLLTITDLRTYFHTVDGLSKAVDGLNLEIARGENLMLMGAFLKLGLLALDEEVVEKEIIKRWPKAEKQNIKALRAGYDFIEKYEQTVQA